MFGVLDGLVEALLAFPWYWRLLTIVGGVGLVLSLVTISMQAAWQSLARCRTRAESKLRRQPVRVRQTLMHVEPGASVRTTLANVTMTATDEVDEGRDPKP
jgi:hypothetical protein